MSTSLAVKPGNTGRTTIMFPQTTTIFDDLNAITNAISQRAFGLFQQRGGIDGWDLDDWFRAESELLKPVPVEMSESPDAFTIRAEVPGFDAKELTVHAEPNAVYIHGKSEQKKEEKNGKQVKYSEVLANELSRRIDLPKSINPDKVTASLANGVLELSMPKAAPPKAIEIKAA